MGVEKTPTTCDSNSSEYRHDELKEEGEILVGIDPRDLQHEVERSRNVPYEDSYVADGSRAKPDGLDILRAARDGSIVTDRAELDIFESLRPWVKDVHLPENWILAALEDDINAALKYSHAQGKGDTSSEDPSPASISLKSLTEYVETVRMLSKHNGSGQLISASNESDVDVRHPKMDPYFLEYMQYRNYQRKSSEEERKVMDDIRQRWESKFKLLPKHNQELTDEMRQKNLITFLECRNEELNAFKKLAQNDIDKKVLEIEKLYTVFLKHRQMALVGLWSRNDSIDDMLENLDKLRRTVSDGLKDVEDELQVLNLELDISATASRKYVTRMSRIGAKEVREPQKREQERQRRLQDPVSLRYVAKSLDDISLMQKVVQRSIQSCDDLATKLGQVGKAGVASMNAIIEAEQLAEDVCNQTKNDHNSLSKKYTEHVLKGRR